ncbi:unnamed protein product [Lampetra planeri]
MPLLDDDSAAASQQDGNSVAQPSYSAAILSLAWSAQPAKLKDVTSASFIKEFAATSGDWGVAFKRRFFMNADLAGWTEAEALWALPAALDDDTLVAFLTIPPLERSERRTPFSACTSKPRPPLPARILHRHPQSPAPFPLASLHNR